MLSLPGQGDPAQTRTHSAQGRNPDTRALVRVRKPQTFLELNYSPSCEQGAGAEGRAPGTRDRLPSRAPAPRRPETRDGVAAPSDSHRPGKGASSRPSGASQPPNCKQNVEIPGASLAGRLTYSGVSEGWVVSGSPLSPPREPALTLEALDPGPQLLRWPKTPETGGDQASERTAVPRLCTPYY